MYIFAIDETNKEKTENVEYFLNGGLIFKGDRLYEFTSGMSDLRKKYGYARSDILKFDSNSRPKHVSTEAAKGAKIEIIELCRKCECKFVVLLLPHSVSKKGDTHAKFKWSFETLAGHFQFFLASETDSAGFVISDRIQVPNPERMLSELHSEGLRVKDKLVPLTRIVGYSSTCLGATCLLSAVDIVLGTFRYCINNIEKTDKISSMLRSVAVLLWYKEFKGVKYVSERGLILRPKEIKVPAFKERRDKLVESIEKLVCDL